MWQRALIIGGIRSGKSAYAESLVADAESVRYIATAAAPDDDPEFAARIAAHQFRRPASWETIETAAVAEALGAADLSHTLLIEDLGGWVVGLMDRHDAPQEIAALAEAVRACRGRVVLVSPEVGLSVVPPTMAGVEFADLVGELNQAVAAACDSVALVIAGQATWLKRETPVIQKAPVREATVTVAELVVAPKPAPNPAVQHALTERTMALPTITTGIVIEPGMSLPFPDDNAREAAQGHLATLDVPGAGLGELAKVVVFAAGTQGQGVPQAWAQPRMFLLRGEHDGGMAAGDTTGAESAAVTQLAADRGVSLHIVDAGRAEAIEFRPATTPDTVDAALRQGWQLADQAVDSGVDVILLGATGAGMDAAAATVVAASTSAEIAGLLGRVVGPDGTVDDSSWMLRCAAGRDALHRVRGQSMSAREILTELGGPDLALAVGIILGATSRRTPVILDGAVAGAASLVARDLASASRLWCLMPDLGSHPAARTAADLLGFTPLLDLKVSLGEGAGALMALPLLNSALALSAQLPTLPPVLDAPPDFVDDPDIPGADV